MSYVAFEGLDCTGKTTTAKRIEGSRYCQNSPCISRFIPGSLGYFLDSLYYDINNPRQREQDVILDRSYLSVIAYGSALGNRWLRYTEPLFQKPDLVVYLTADAEVRRQRWEKQGRPGFPNTFTEPGFAERVEAEYERLLANYDVARVDTTGKSIDEVVEEVRKLKIS